MEHAGKQRDSFETEISGSRRERNKLLDSVSEMRVWLRAGGLHCVELLLARFQLGGPSESLSSSPSCYERLERVVRRGAGLSGMKRSAGSVQKAQNFP